MAHLAIFGIENSGLNLAVDLVLLALVVIWLTMIYWTYSDARRRIADPMLVGCATAASLFPFVGTLVYTIARPPEYLDDVHERELEIQIAEARLAQVGFQVCPHCDAEVERTFLRCPNCLRKLKDPCAQCGKPLDPSWKICPYCEADVAPVTSAARRSGRRRREVAPTDEPPREPRERPARERPATARERPATARERPAREGREGSTRDTPARDKSARDKPAESTS